MKEERRQSKPEIKDHASLPYVSVMQPVLKPKIKISTPQRPTLGTNGLTQSPRKRKVVPIKSSVSVMPFAEKNTTGSFTPLGLGVDAGRGGIRGIGTGGAMPFRKLGQREFRDQFDAATIMWKRALGFLKCSKRQSQESKLG